MRCLPGRYQFSLKASFLACYLTAASLLGGAQASPGGETLTLSYEIYFGGMHFVSSTVEMKKTDADYEIFAEGQSRGLFDFLIGWTGSAKSAGRLTEKGTRPVFHQNQGQWKGRTRQIRLEYSPDKGPEITILKETEREDAPEVTPVDLAAIRQTIDPISTILDLALQLSSEENCQADREIYDGRRHYRIRLSDAGIDEIKPNDYSSYAGPARKCALEVDRIGGFIKNPSQMGRNPRNRMIYVAQPENAPLPLPVRVEVETDYGWLMIHLTGFDRS